MLDASKDILTAFNYRLLAIAILWGGLDCFDFRSSPPLYTKKKTLRGDGSARYHRKIRDFPGLGGFHPPRRFPYRSSPPPYTNKKTLRGDGSARYGAGLLIRCSLNSGVRIPLPALIFVCLRSKHTKVRGGFGPLGSWTFVSFIARRRSKMSKMSHFAEVRIPLPAPILLVRLK